jgi:trk system potassium uptake protein TrkA
MRIVIVGAGKTGEFLASRLVRSHQVALIESRSERVAEVRQMLPNVDVFEGDACEPAVLERAGVPGADLVVAATGDDEDNLVVAMLSKHYEAKSVYGRINHPSNEWLFDKEWGVDAAVSSPAVLYGLIEKDVGFGDLITLLKLQADNIAIEEITLPSGATAETKSLSEIPLPSNAQVMAILARDGTVTIARGDTRLFAGDQILLLSDGCRSEEIRAAFGIPAPASAEERPEPRQH